jgi:hypothetical protein
MNDYIQQTISSSPICLSKIAVPPAKSARTLIVRMSMRVCPLRIFMEQQAVIRFLTLKGLRASAIAAELKSAYETEVFALSPVTNWRKRFAEGRISPYNDSGCGRLLTNDLAEVISSTLKKRPYLSCQALCGHFRTAKGVCLRILYETLDMKNFIFVGFPMPWTRIRRPKQSLSRMEFFWYYRALVLLVSRVSSLEMNHSSFCTIPVIRYGCRHEMKCQKESVKKLTSKSV